MMLPTEIKLLEVISTYSFTNTLLLELYVFFLVLAIRKLKNRKTIETVFFYLE